MLKFINDDVRVFLSRGYLVEGESAESRYEDIGDAFYNHLLNMGMGLNKAAKFHGDFMRYVSEGYFSLSSPIISNYGRDRGLPISCNGSYIPDSVEGMKYKDAEIAVMTKHGAGTSAYVGDIRPRGTPVSSGGYADGVSLPAAMLDSTINLISQGTVRRGNISITYDIEGDDFWEFMDFREEGSAVQNVSLGLTVSDEFMNKVEARDPEAMKRWLAVIRKRFESGYPYIMFKNTVNRNKPEWYEGCEILASNLCQEIALPSSFDESFVCCLMSMNLDLYDEWKETNAVEVAIVFLDTVIEEYINKARGMMFMDAAVRFAKRHRALGLGTLGYHSYLQRNNMPFESFNARAVNVRMHRDIFDKAEAASRMLADEFGEADVCKGYGRRNATLIAIAPTTSSSFILGQVSPGIEPLASNYFTKDLAKGSFTYKNPYLTELLDEIGKNNYETWMSILERGGSVQHLDFLTQDQKDVFKTFSEIAPMEVIRQASARQKFIDQSQSLNLMIHPDAELKEVNTLMFEAWRLGVKNLYYQRGTNPAQEASKNIMACSACEA